MDLPMPVYCSISEWVVDFPHAHAQVISSSADNQLMYASNPTIV